MREVPITIHGTADPKAFDRFASTLREQRTLGDVLAWSKTLVPSRTVTEIITQDEYTHDVLLQLEGETYLVYDTT